MSRQSICDDTEPPLFFVDGKAGRGKTYTLNTLSKHLHSNRFFVAICRSTALSATLYPRDCTAHSLFGIPVTDVRCLFPTFSYYLKILIVYCLQYREIASWPQGYTHHQIMYA